MIQSSFSNPSSVRHEKPSLRGWATALGIGLALGLSNSCSVNRAARQINEERAAHDLIARTEAQLSGHEHQVRGASPLLSVAEVEAQANRKLIAKLDLLAQQCQEPGIDLRTIRSRIRCLFNDLDEIAHNPVGVREDR